MDAKTDSHMQGRMRVVPPSTLVLWYVLARLRKLQTSQTIGHPPSWTQLIF
jgi:hypothetical protein